MAKDQGKINKAQEQVKAGGGEKREKPRTASVGNEKTASQAALGSAVAELHRQHPIPYSDHGPHHGTTTHIRHEPLAGMSPAKARD